MLKALYGWGYRVALVIWLLVLLVIGAIFAKKNTEVLEVDLVFSVLPPMSSGLLISLALALGVVIGGATFIPAWLLSKARVRRLKSRLSKLEEKAAEKASNNPKPTMLR